MIKTLSKILAIMCVLHLLAGLGFVGWLYTSGRLDRERFNEVVEIFSTTLQEDAAEAEARAAADADALEISERVLAIAKKADGEGTADERVEADRLKNEMELNKMERVLADVEALRRNLRFAQAKVKAQKDELVKKQTLLNERLAKLEKRANDKGFQKAIVLYESLPAKQTKDMFLGLIEGGAVDQVVAYLEAMQPRKAAKILQEFKRPDEVARATELLEQLRTRGSTLVKDAEATG